MPLYVYRCGACSGEFNSMHSMKTTINVCSLCKVADNLSRIPQVVSFGKQETTADGKKTGEVVKDHIEQTQKEVKEEKERLKTKDYKP